MINLEGSVVQPRHRCERKRWSDHLIKSNSTLLPLIKYNHSKQWHMEVLWLPSLVRFWGNRRFLCHISSLWKSPPWWFSRCRTDLHSAKKAQFSLFGFRSVKMSNEPSIEGIFVMPMLRNILLSQSCLPEVWFDSGVSWTVYLHLNIWMSVCSWQMASVSHLYSRFFTDELVSNVFSVAFRSVMMIRSYVWEKKDMYLFLYWEHIIYFQKMILKNRVLDEWLFIPD